MTFAQRCGLLSVTILGLALPGPGLHAQSASAPSPPPPSADPPPAPVAPFQAQWSSRSGNFWLYVMNGQGNVSACDWTGKPDERGTVECLARTHSSKPVPCDASKDAFALVVPTNADNNAFARLSTVTGCVRICYLQRGSGTGATTSMVCTDDKDPFGPG